MKEAFTTGLFWGFTVGGPIAAFLLLFVPEFKQFILAYIVFPLLSIVS